MREAVVLRRQNFKEWDELISLYTKEQGKLELTVRGTKKITSKNSPFLEPFSCVHIGVVGGKDRQYITTVQSLEYFSAIRQNVQKSWQAGFVIAWLEDMLKPFEQSIEIYDTLLSWLHFLNTIPQTKGVFVDAFLWKVVSLLGFEPRLYECVVCNRELAEEKIYFSFSSGGIVCQKDKLDQREGVHVALAFSTLLALRYILNRSWREIDAFTSPDVYKGVHKIVYPYIMYSTEKNFGDWERNF